MGTFIYGKGLNDGKHYFQLKATNGESILHSNQGYETRQGCIDGMASVRLNAPYDHNYNSFVGTDGQFYFNLKATNGQVIGQSEGYKASSSRDQGIESCKREAPNASEREI